MKKKKTNKKNTDELTKLIQIVLAILVIFSGFYLLTYFLKENKSFNYDNSNKTPAVIQYEEILAGTVLNQNSEDYYVLIKNTDSKLEYKSLINMYYQMGKKTELYYVDMNSIFNKKYISENNNLMIDDITELEVADTAIIHVKDGKVTSQKIGEEEVYSKLLSLTEGN